MRKTTSFIVIILAIVLASCSSIDCQLNGRVLCSYSLRDARDSAMAFAFPLTITLLRDSAHGGDTTYISQLEKASTFDLPMSHAADEDVIRLTLTVPDTVVEHDPDTSYVVYHEFSDVIRIKKTNEPFFESIDCTPRYNHTITEVSSTHNFLDTIIINNATVTNDASKKNIILRARTSL